VNCPFSSVPKNVLPAVPGERIYTTRENRILGAKVAAKVTRIALKGMEVNGQNEKGGVQNVGQGSARDIVEKRERGKSPRWKKLGLVWEKSREGKRRNRARSSPPRVRGEKSPGVD